MRGLKYKNKCKSFPYIFLIADPNTEAMTDHNQYDAIQVSV